MYDIQWGVGLTLYSKETKLLRTIVNQVSNELKEALAALERNEISLATLKLLRAQTTQEVLSRRLEELLVPGTYAGSGSGFIEKTMKAVENSFARHAIRPNVSPAGEND